MDIIFDEDTIYDFDPNTFEIGREIWKGNMKYHATTTSNIYNKKNKPRVKLSKFPDFNSKQDSWIKSRSSFKAITEASGIWKYLNEVLEK